MSEQSFTRVRDVMRPIPLAVDGLATVREALDAMSAAKAPVAVINRRDPGDEYGIVSVHDIAEKIIEPDRSPERMNLYEIMTKPVLSVHADMNIRYAIRLLNRFDLPQGLVIDHGEAIGLAMLSDMVFRYMDEQRSAGG